MNQLKQLRRNNNKLDKQLSPENSRIIMDMVCYLRSSNLSDYDLEIMRRELTGMALEAQLRGDDFNSVIGSDHKMFCEELMINGRQKTVYDKVLEMAYILIFGVGTLYLIEIILSPALKGLIQLGQYMLPITAGFLISTVLICIIAFGIYYYVATKSFELSKPGSKSKCVFIVGFATVWTVILLCKLHFKTVLITVNMFYPLAFFAIAYIIIKLLTDRHDNRYFVEKQ